MNPERHDGIGGGSRTPAAVPGTVQSPAGTRYQLVVHARVGVAEVAARMEHLTFPSLRQRLASQHLPTRLSAAAVCWGTEPVGLVVAACGRGSTAEVLSLYVRRDHRGRGLSRVLLRGLERLLGRQGIRSVHCAYRSDWPACPLLERRLRELGWEPPVNHLSLGKFNLREVTAAWRSSSLHRCPLPPSYRIQPWTELTYAELNGLLDPNAGESAEDLAPLEEPDSIEPLTSLVLRQRKRIIAWLVTHRLDARTIQYTRLHVDPAHRRLGRGLPLITTAVQRQIDVGVPFGVFQVRSDNTRMLRLVERRIRPYLLTWTESRRSQKQLAAPVAPTVSDGGSAPTIANRTLDLNSTPLYSR